MDIKTVISKLSQYKNIFLNNWDGKPANIEIKSVVPDKNGVKVTFVKDKGTRFEHLGIIIL